MKNLFIISALMAFLMPLSFFRSLLFAKVTRKSCLLTPSLCVEMALKSAFDVKMAEVTVDLSECQREKKKGEYGIFLNNQIAFSKSDSLGFPATKDISLLTKDISVVKKNHFGGSWKLTSKYFRNFTDSVYDLGIIASFNQSLRKNAFGRSDRLYDKVLASQIDIASLEKKKTMMAIIENALEKFWSVYYCRELKNIQKKTCQILRSLLKIARKKASVKTVEEKDLLLIWSHLKQKELEFVDIENRLLSSWECLSNDLGYKKSFSTIFFDKKDFLLPPKISSFEEIYQKALEHRIDLLMVKRVLEKNKMLLKIDRDNLKADLSFFISSSIDLGGSLKKTSLVSLPMFGRENMGDLVLGLKTSRSFSKTLEKKKVEERELEIKKQSLLKEKIKKDLHKNLTLSYHHFQNSRKKYRIAQKLIKINRKKVKFIFEDYSMGRSNVETLVQAQEDLLNSKKLMIAELLQTHIHLTRLQFLSGEWEELFLVKL